MSLRSRVFGLGLLWSLLLTASAAQAAPPKIQTWDMVELAFAGPRAGNPFTDVELRAEFTLGKEHVQVRGFYDGEGKYVVRYMPSGEGTWQYRTLSNNPQLDGKTGSVQVTKSSGTNHGPVRVVNGAAFAFADGTSYHPIGTTIYGFPHQPMALQQQTLSTLSQAPFNKLRFCVFPKWYSFNRTEPLMAPFEKRADGRFDIFRPNPAYYKLLEQRIVELQKLGIEADLILFHPYDEGHWGFDRMGRDADQQYLRYVIARLGAYRNVWWSMANEWDLVKQKSKGDWTDLIKIVQQEDPYKKLCSIHQAHEAFDHAHPGITHLSVQSSDPASLAPLISKFKKPVIDDECEYEGDIEQSWGNIDAQELIHRMWQGTVRGVYVGHGETFRTPDEVLWWSKGGVLRGQSPKRMAFLRDLLEKGGRMEPVDFTPRWAPIPVAKQGNAFIMYFGRHAPSYFTGDTISAVEKVFPDSKGKAWKLELIDPWNMTVSPLGAYSQTDKPEMKLPARMYLAIRATPQ
jgi:hypothetical protein